MSHPNRLYNADFAQDLSQWTAAGGASFIASQGYRELGAAYLQSGDSIAQPFTVGIGRPYMVEVAVKSVSGTGSLTLTITTASEAATVYTSTIAVTASWVLNSTRVGLPWGDYVLTLAYSNVAVYVDDVSIAFVPATRAELATTVAARLGVLATAASMTTTLSGSNTEGDYTAAVDEGLRAVGAMDPAGRVDVRYLEPDSVTACQNEIEMAMLKTLHRYWVTKTDYQLGPRQEKLNQIQQALLALTGAAVGGRPPAGGRSVKTRQLIHTNEL